MTSALLVATTTCLLYSVISFLFQHLTPTYSLANLSFVFYSFDTFLPLQYRNLAYTITFLASNLAFFFFVDTFVPKKPRFE